MNYTNDKSMAISIEKRGLDKNGNRIKRITFYKNIDGVMIEQKKRRTNDNLDNCTVEEIIKIWY